MPPATNTIFLQWNQALLDAADRAGRSAPGVRLFHERREDLTVELLPDGSIRQHRTLWSGLSATSLGPGARRVYRSEPPIGEIDRIVETAMTGAQQMATAPRAAEARRADDGTGEVEDPIPPLVHLARRVSEMHGSARVYGRAVAFDQRVRIVETGRDLLEDRRRGLRIRLEAALERGSAHSTAVVELVRPPRTVELAPDRLERLAGRLAERLETRLHSREPKPGQLETVFGPGVGGILVHEIVGHALEADVARAGGTWLTDVTGRLAPMDLVVLDDPRRGRAAWRIDDEGHRTRPVPLIRSGRVAGRLHDASTAAREGVSSTGHGRRASYRDAIRPRMGCTFVAAGRWRPEEVLNSVSDGLYVRRMEAASVDLSTGRAIFRVTDSDRIVNGVLDSPLQPHLLEVDARSALGGMDRVADDLTFDTCVGSCVRDGQPLATSVGAPTICIGRTRVVR